MSRFNINTDIHVQIDYTYRFMCPDLVYIRIYHIYYKCMRKLWPKPDREGLQSFSPKQTPHHPRQPLAVKIKKSH